MPCGVLSLATYLNEKMQGKMKSKILDLNLYDDYLSILEQNIVDFSPDIIGISLMFDVSYIYLQDITSTIKRKGSKAKILLGGAAATSSYKEILEDNPSIDAICYYEGELPLLRFIKSDGRIDFLDKDPSWITKKSLLDKPLASNLQNLDDVIHLDYSLINYSDYKLEEAFSPFVSKAKVKKHFFLFTSRGCKFKCYFCIHSSHNDSSIRYASVEKVINHVKYLVDTYGLNVLTIYDDQILFNKNRAKNIFRELSKLNIRIECPNGLSPAYIDEEMAYLMKAAGMDTVCLAIESGSEHVLNNIIKKPLKLKKLPSVINFLRKNEFWIQAFFVLGLPGETDTHRQETLKFIKHLGLDWSSFSLATPSKGSKLYTDCIKNGYIDKNIPLGGIDNNKYIIKTPEYSPEYISEQAYLINLDVNFVNNYRMLKGDYRTSRLCFEDIIRRYPSHAFAHYYLSKSLNRGAGSNDDKDMAEKHMKNFEDIIKNNASWREKSEYFNLV